MGEAKMKERTEIKCVIHKLFSLLQIRIKVGANFCLVLRKWKARLECKTTFTRNARGCDIYDFLFHISLWIQSRLGHMPLFHGPFTLQLLIFSFSIFGTNEPSGSRLEKVELFFIFFFLSFFQVTENSNTTIAVCEFKKIVDFYKIIGRRPSIF